MKKLIALVIALVLATPTATFCNRTIYHHYPASTSSYGHGPSVVVLPRPATRPVVVPMPVPAYRPYYSVPFVPPVPVASTYSTGATEVLVAVAGILTIAAIIAALEKEEDEVIHVYH